MLGIQIDDRLVHFSIRLHPPKISLEVSMVVHACNLCTQEAEAALLRFRSQPELHSKKLSQKPKQNKKFLKI